MRKKRAIVIMVIAAIIGITGWKIYTEYNLRQSGGWKDAHPTKEQIDKWLVKNFNPGGFKVWNKNPRFEGFDFDKNTDQYLKTIWNQENYFTPFGDDDWGASCFTWDYIENGKETKTYPVKMCYLYPSLNNVGDRSIFVFVSHYNYREYNDNYDRYGYYGVGAILQGWAHPKPPPFNHHIPSPLEISNKKIVLSFDINISHAGIDTQQANAWQFIGINLWLKSPELKKRAVMDLMLYTSGKILHTENAPEVYRYQKVVVKNQKETLRKWRHYDIDISWFIADMLKRFEIERAAPTLKLLSLEILCETVFGKCGFYTKNVYLYYK